METTKGNQEEQRGSRQGRGAQSNMQGDAKQMGIYLAIPSSEHEGEYVEFDLLTPESAHEITGMQLKLSRLEESTNTINEGGNRSGSQQGEGGSNNFSGETPLTEKYGHSGTPGKSLAPDSEDGRKTSEIRGGKGEGINQRGGK